MKYNKVKGISICLAMMMLLTGNVNATSKTVSHVIKNTIKNAEEIRKISASPILNKVNKAENLPKVSFEQEGLNENIKNNISKWMENRSVGEVIKGDVNQFPLEFGNVVITGIERIPYNSKSPLYKTGWDTDAIIVHGYPIKENDKNGLVKGYGLDSLRLALISKSGDISNENNIPLEDKNIIQNLKAKYPNIIEGDFAKANVGQNFSVLYQLGDGFSINNLKKVIIQDTYFSTNDVLEIDMSQIK